MIKHVSCIVSVALLLGGCQSIANPPADIANTQTSSSNGVVSAADPRAAEAGAQILRQGGSATDAAIAVMLALTVVEPQSSGIGGGGFLLHSDATGAMVSIDGRETAPAEAGADWFLDENGEPLEFLEAVIGGRSIGVPGSVALAAQAHEDYGQLAWADLFQPAIRLAREGWDLSPRGAYFAEQHRERAAHSPGGAALFYDGAGTVLPVGTRLTNAALADTLEALAKDGPDHLYRNNAQALAQHVSDETPGNAAMRSSDITEYEALVRRPVCGDYREYRICSMGPPSSGATTVIAILGQLERFDMAGLGAQSVTAWHLFAESQRLAYADREVYLADPAFSSVPASLTSPAYLQQRSMLISADDRMEQAIPGTPPGIAIAPPDGDEPEENGTSHFAVTDNAGNVVSWTSTVEGAFGSGLMFGGFYLNNELTDFSFLPNMDGVPVANRVEGGKRPRSSMAPTIVFGADGTPVLAIGAAGGSTIPVQVAKALIGYIDWDMTAQDAIVLPVLYSPGDSIVLEDGNQIAGLQAQLEAMGHNVSLHTLPLKANAVELKDGRWIGGADPRSEGAWISQ